jgi:pyruvate formate lyase activating enzyme
MSLSLVDLYLFDIKMLDDNLHKTFTGASNRRILANLARLGEDGASICLRLPLMAGLNDAVSDMEGIAAWLGSNNVKPVYINLLPYHAYARGKYANMGLEAPPFNAPDAERLENIRNFWINKSYPAAVGGENESGSIVGRFDNR